MGRVMLAPNGGKNRIYDPKMHDLEINRKHMLMPLLLLPRVTAVQRFLT